jgi:hypothetical protein
MGTFPEKAADVTWNRRAHAVPMNRTRRWPVAGRRPGCVPSSGQGLGYGVQGKSNACSYHGAVDADVLQVGPEEQF